MRLVEDGQKDHPPKIQEQELWQIWGEEILCAPDPYHRIKVAVSETLVVALFHSGITGARQDWVTPSVTQGRGKPREQGRLKLVSAAKCCRRQ